MTLKCGGRSCSDSNLSGGQCGGLLVNAASVTVCLPSSCRPAGQSVYGRIWTASEVCRVVLGYAAITAVVATGHWAVGRNTWPTRSTDHLQDGHASWPKSTGKVVGSFSLSLLIEFHTCPSCVHQKGARVDVPRPLGNDCRPFFIFLSLSPSLRLQTIGNISVWCSANKKKPVQSI